MASTKSSVELKCIDGSFLVRQRSLWTIGRIVAVGSLKMLVEVFVVVVNFWITNPKWHVEKATTCFYYQRINHLTNLQVIQ